MGGPVIDFSQIYSGNDAGTLCMPGGMRVYGLPFCVS